MGFNDVLAVMIQAKGYTFLGVFLLVNDKFVDMKKCSST